MYNVEHHAYMGFYAGTQVTHLIDQTHLNVIKDILDKSNWQ